MKRAAIGIAAAAAIALCIAGGGHAQSDGSQPVTISIRFYDKAVYFPGSEIPIKVTVRNEGSQPFRFKLAEDRAYSISFEVRTLSNVRLPSSDAYSRKLASASPVFYREVVIEPSEEYSFVEDLALYVLVKDPGAYRVNLAFYPELFRGTQSPRIPSNELALSVRPGSPDPTTVAGIEAMIETPRRADKLPPDRVVENMLLSRIKERWDEFFSYFKIDKMIQRDPERKRLYDRQSDEGRRRMEEEWRASIVTGTSTDDILPAVTSFEIVQTFYSRGQGTVVSRQKYDRRRTGGGDYVEVKLYTYELSLIDGEWYIVGYTVKNEKAE